MNKNKTIKKIIFIFFFIILFLSLRNLMFPISFLKPFSLAFLVSATFTITFVPYMFIKVLILIFSNIRTILIINSIAKKLKLKSIFPLFTKKREVKSINNGYEISIKLTNLLECEELFLSELVGIVSLTPWHAIFSFITPYTEIKLTSNKNIVSSMVVRKENMFDNIIKNINIQDVEIGDPEFDEQFLIKCDDEKILKNVLNEGVREQIKKIDQKSIIRVIENKIYYTQKGGIRDKEYLIFIINLLVKIADSIKQ